MTPVLEGTRKSTPRPPTIRRRSPLGVRSVAAALVAAVVVTIAWVTPAVRLELRRSFTRLPTQYTELYFTQEPTLERSSAGYVAIVPVSVVSHGFGVRAYAIDVSLTADGGQVLDASTVRIEARSDVPTGTIAHLRPQANIGIPAPSGTPARSPSYVVRVALVGQPQSLHYRLAQDAS
jgi:hypothetical protein